MKLKKPGSFLLFTLLGLLLLSACGQATDIPTETEVAQVVEEATATEEQVEEPTPTATQPEPTEAPTLEPTLEPTVEEINEAQSCINCHSDKDRLIDTADPVEVVETENEGEG